MELTSKDLAVLLAKRLKDEARIPKADIMHFEEEKSYAYTSDWSGVLVRVFDGYVKYLRGKGEPDPWRTKMTTLYLAQLDKTKECYPGPVMFGEFLRNFLVNPFHSPFRKIGDRYQFPTKEGWRRVSHRDFFGRVREYLWYHFRLWSKALLLEIGELEESSRGPRLKNLAPLLAKRMGPGMTYICEDDQVRFVQKWLAPRITNMSVVPCINFAALKALLERCSGLGMITF